MVLGVELGSLYFTRIVIDFILVFYMILIYRKFNNHIQNLEYLIIHRVLILVGFVMVYLRDSISLFLSVIVGNTLFIIGAASLIFLFSQLFKIPFKKFYHIFIILLFLLSYIATTYYYPSIRLRRIILSITILIQYGPFILKFAHNLIQKKEPYSKILLIDLRHFTILLRTQYFKNMCIYSYPSRK